MHPLPQTGVLTFLFTDIEGSTTRWERSPDAMADALATHDRLVGDALARHGGRIFKRSGDAFCCAFTLPVAAVLAAADVQRKLASQAWDRAVGEVRVRIAIHTGDALASDDDYFGPTLNRTARLMSAGHGGQVLLSAATAALVRGALPPGYECKSLGSQRLRDLTQPETIYQLNAPDLPQNFAPLRTLDARPNNLPLELSSFVGREAELSQLRELIAHRRLVTVCGPGGIGKTRLALHAAGDLLDDFPDGAWVVMLAPIADANLVLQAIASALDIGEAAGETLEATLRRELAAKRMILVLDNAEHLLPAVADRVKAIVEGARDLHVLVTSRQPLHVSGEAVFRLGPIDIAQAKRLFLDRSQSAVSDFAPDECDADDLDAIAAALQGVPLAIELAAGRMTTLSLHQIRERLAAQLAFLRTASSEDARHRALRETIAWSFDLLAPPEQEALGSLSVFAGGFTIDSCETIAGADALDLVEELVDKSFLAVNRGAKRARYHMLDAIAQYARERMSPAALEKARSQHFACFAAKADRSNGELPHGKLAEWLDEIDDNVANVRAALAYGFEQGEPALGPMLTGLFRFWYIRRTVKEGRMWLQRFIDSAGEAHAELPSVLRRASSFASIEGDYEYADELARRALTLFHAAKNEPGILEALHALAVNETRRGNYNGAERLYGDIAARCAQAGQERAAVTSTANRASIRLKAGDVNGAEALLRECSRRVEALGDDDVYATVVALNGTLAFRRAQWDDAENYFEKALTIKKGLKSELGICEISAALAAVYAQKGERERAIARAAEGLEIALELDEPRIIVSALEACALSALRCGQRDEAADAFGLSIILRRMHSIRDTPALGTANLRDEIGDASADEHSAASGWKNVARSIAQNLRAGAKASLT